MTIGESRRVSDIQRLVALWRFLEAEQVNQAAIAKTDEEAEALICQHGDEQSEIEMKLSRLLPQDFDDVREILEFAADMIKENDRPDGGGLMMLENILKSLPGVLGNTKEAARKAGMEEMRRTRLLSARCSD
jgi:hypothetical protein